MTTKQARRSRPEERELARQRRELGGLESELAERELRLASLRAELVNFEQRFLATVGARYATLDELRAQLAERAARENPGDERVQELAREARARAANSHSAASSAEARKPKSFSPSPALKGLYREVARRIHPDLTADPADRQRRQELMAEANRAYEQGDDERLEHILEEYESSPEAVQGDGTAAELVRVIRKISQANGRLTQIETELTELDRSDLCRLKAVCEDQEKHGRNLLEEMGRRIEEQAESLRQGLERTAPSRSVV